MSSASDIDRPFSCRFQIPMRGNESTQQFSKDRNARHGFKSP